MWHFIILSNIYFLQNILPSSPYSSYSLHRGTTDGQTHRIQQKLFAHEALPNKWLPVSLKNWTCRNQTNRTTQKSKFRVAHDHFFPSFFKKSGKPTAEDWSLFTTTMQAFTHRLKQLHFWALKTSIWWVIHSLVLTWHNQCGKTSFDNWFQRLKKFIDLNGENLENNKVIFNDQYLFLFSNRII